MIYEELKKLFDTKGHEEAKEFLHLWSAYCDLVDDTVDEEKDSNRVRKLTTLASQVYNCPYWIRQRNNLLPTERLIHNEYFDSTIWEQSMEDWKRRRAKVYSNAGLNMVLLIVLIEFGQTVADSISLKLREYAYEKHKDDAI